MEKAMSVEERIRRAENIYNRRNGQYTRIPIKEKATRNKTSIKKMFMQIFICLSIYVIFYAVTNREYIFSEAFRNEVNAFFTEKTKISEFYTNAKTFITNKIFGNQNEENAQPTQEQNEQPTEEETKENNQKSQETQENSETTSQNTDTNTTSSIKQDDDIGGSVDVSKESPSTSVDNEKKENLSEEEQMKLDAEYIKSKVNFITPVTGRISSTFGWRNPTTATVPRYHTGLDIAVNEGTKIKSATNGKVVLVSSQGDYGNHYQIQVDDIIIIYAHCKTLYLKEGDSVSQGQDIAEVGSTGNTTGPHLHFEIRLDGRKVDPQLILNI